MSVFASHRSKIHTMHRAGHITDKARDRALSKIQAAEDAEMAAQAPPEPAGGDPAAMSAPGSAVETPPMATAAGQNDAPAPSGGSPSAMGADQRRLRVA